MRGWESNVKYRLAHPKWGITLEPGNKISVEVIS